MRNHTFFNFSWSAFWYFGGVAGILSYMSPMNPSISAMRSLVLRGLPEKVTCSRCWSSSSIRQPTRIIKGWILQANWSQLVICYANSRMHLRFTVKMSAQWINLAVILYNNPLTRDIMKQALLLYRGMIYLNIARCICRWMFTGFRPR